MYNHQFQMSGGANAETLQIHKPLTKTSLDEHANGFALLICAVAIAFGLTGLITLPVVHGETTEIVRRIEREMKKEEEDDEEEPMGERIKNLMLINYRRDSAKAVKHATNYKRLIQHSRPFRMCSDCRIILN